MRCHESFPPLLRGVGLTVILLGTVLATIQARDKNKERANAEKPAHEAGAPAVMGGRASTNDAQAQSLERLTREVEELRETVEDETVVEEVLSNPWFDVLGIIGSGIMATSFYLEWGSKRPARGSPKGP